MPLQETLSWVVADTDYEHLYYRQHSMFIWNVRETYKHVNMLIDNVT